MLLGKYVITAHAIQQYDGRIQYRTADDIIKCIKHDLRTLNIKNIIYRGKHIHVFTKGYKEFIFVKSKNCLFLKTIIKRNKEDTQRAIQKRKNLVAVAR
jgi:hypothetical protein